MSPSARDRLESTSTHKIFRILFAEFNQLKRRQMASEYSTDQIDRYLEYISIPAQYRREAQPKLDLEFLTALHTHQLATIPYENLAMHYSTDHLVYLDPQILYKKLTTNGRGGYCMENCIFYNHVLQALGFSVYTTGVRIRFRVDGVPQGNYRGFTHSVNLVTLEDGSKYMVDVAFGGDGAVKPLPLIDGHITQNIGTQQLRLVYDNIEQQFDKKQKFWIYQYRNNPNLPWNSFYHFSETEFIKEDFGVMSYYTSTNTESFLLYATIVVKFLRKDNEISGKVMLANHEVKQNTGGRTRVIKTCKTEQDRIDALKEYFGITLTADEQRGIRGLPSELSQD